MRKRMKEPRRWNLLAITMISCTRYLRVKMKQLEQKERLDLLRRISEDIVLEVSILLLARPRDLNDVFNRVTILMDDSRTSMDSVDSLLFVGPYDVEQSDVFKRYECWASVFVVPCSLGSVFGKEWGDAGTGRVVQFLLWITVR
jgi:hypothetical protein